MAEITDEPAESLSPDQANELLVAMYEDLRSIARNVMLGSRQNLTLQATDLVHLAFEKLKLKLDGGPIETPETAIPLFVTTMKNVLRDHLRRRRRLKRGGEGVKVPLDEWLEPIQSRGIEPENFIEVCDELERLDDRKHKIVVLRVFYKLTNEEIAAQLGVSVSTVEDDFRQVRVWLGDRLKALESGPKGTG